VGSAKGWGRAPQSIPCVQWRRRGRWGSLGQNTKKFRDFENDTFEIRALHPITTGEELTHVYKTLGWRLAL